MKRIGFLFSFLSIQLFVSQSVVLDDEMASLLAQKPLHCINQEYPNKTGHTINTKEDATLTPKELHPSFYGCFDWHSSVHGHWMLVRLFKTKPNLSHSKEIENVLENSFQPEKLKAEAEYFSKFPLSKNFERTYGWAWVLKLDEELSTWNDERAEKWHQALQPLTQIIVQKWKDFLPKQTYPNRTGVHGNTAFALTFALDWARAVGDIAFEKEIIEKAKYFYLNEKKTPAHLEPDGADFFSPSLNIAYLMSKILSQKEFSNWLSNFYTKKGLENIEKEPIVSDLNDYQIVHLVGLSFSKSWCMKGISKALPRGHKLKENFSKRAEIFLQNAFPLLQKSNYGGDHWLASFAMYSMKEQ